MLCVFVFIPLLVSDSCEVAFVFEWTLKQHLLKCSRYHELLKRVYLAERLEAVDLAANVFEKLNANQHLATRR